MLISFTAVLKGQVTIGSDIPARKGTILDLKENDNTGKLPNSTKGLGLPRVALSSLTTLTVDDDSKKNDYVGLTVYNTTINSDLTEGTYCWFGDTWKQVVLISDSGTDGNLLISNGDYTYKWASISIPEYEFSKPTQASTFDPSKAKTFQYSTGDIIYTYVGNNQYRPRTGLFDNDFVYTETLNLQTDATSEKYILLETSISVKKRTVSNAPAAKGFWEQMRVEVLVNNVVKERNERVFSTAQYAETTTIIDHFSIIPLSGLNKGSYDLKIRVSNLSNLYNTNKGNSSGQFPTSSDFFTVTIEDIGFILYEED